MSYSGMVVSIVGILVLTMIAEFTQFGYDGYALLAYSGMVILAVYNLYEARKPSSS